MSRGTAMSTMKIGLRLRARTAARTASYVITGVGLAVELITMSASGRCAAMCVDADREAVELRGQFLRAVEAAIRDDHAAAGHARAGGARPVRSFRRRRPAAPCGPAKFSNTVRASETAADATDTAFAPMRVCVRTRLATENAVCISRFRYGPVTRCSSAARYASLSWPRICGSPSTSESRPQATANTCWTAGVPCRRYSDCVEYPGCAAVRSCQPLSHATSGLARLAVSRETVQLGPVAGGNDQRFAHAGDAAQFPQGFGQLLAREYDFFADFDGRGAVIDSYDDEWHAGACRKRLRIVREGHVYMTS